MAPLLRGHCSSTMGSYVLYLATILCVRHDEQMGAVMEVCEARRRGSAMPYSMRIRMLHSKA